MQPTLKTERRREGYVIAEPERGTLAPLSEKYQIGKEDEGRVNLVNSVNSPRGQEEVRLV